jgi:hypothetical protein
MVAQVDGGSGHSGKRAPELHFGLGRVAAGTPLRVDLRWRDGDGRVRAETIHLVPGRHTIVLGEPTTAPPPAVAAGGTSKMQPAATGKAG